MGPWYELEFIFGEGNRLRIAEPFDPPSGVIARPRIRKGIFPEAAEHGISWAHPLSNFWKADEEEDRFLKWVEEIGAGDQRPGTRHDAEFGV
jgi:hypothetical protein